MLAWHPLPFPDEGSAQILLAPQWLRRGCSFLGLVRVSNVQRVSVLLRSLRWREAHRSDAQELRMASDFSNGAHSAKSLP